MNAPPKARFTCVSCDAPVEQAPSDQTPLVCVTCFATLHPASSTDLTIVTRQGGLASRRHAKLVLTPEFVAAYKMGDVLGAGAMGMVFAAQQASTGRPVAIKFLVGSDDVSAIERFTAEGRLLARLSHPAILRVYDSGVQSDCPYLVTDVLTGGSLRERLSRTKYIPISDAKELTLRLLEGLQECHENQILHRDLKPENVMFDGAGQPVIVDLGLGRLMTGSAGLTKTGALLGTPRYMAPEQWNSEVLGPATDLYAVGLMMFEMIAGRRPFQGTTLAEVMQMHCCEPAPRLDSVTEVPTSLADVVARALEKDPSARYSSAAAMAQEIDVVGRPLSRKPVITKVDVAERPRPAMNHRPPVRRRSSALLLGLLVLGSGLGVWRLRTMSVSQPPRGVAMAEVRSRVASSPTRVSTATLPDSPWGWVHRIDPGLDQVQPLPPGARARVGDTFARCEQATEVAISQTGVTLATVQHRSMAKIWSRSERKLIREIETGSTVLDIGFTRDDSVIAIIHGSPTTPKEVRGSNDLSGVWCSTWDVRTGMCLGRVRDLGSRARNGRNTGGTSLSIGRVSPNFAVGFPSSLGSCAALVVDLRSGRQLQVPLPEPPTSLEVSADGSLLLAQGKEAYWVIDVKTGLVHSTNIRPESTGGTGWSVALSPNGRNVACAGAGLLSIRDGATGNATLLHRVPGAKDLRWSPDGESLAVVTTQYTSGTIADVHALLNARSGRTQVIRGHQGQLRFSSEGSRLAIGRAREAVDVFQIQNGHVKIDGQAAHGLECLAIDPRVTRMAAERSGVLSTLDLSTGATKTIERIWPPNLRRGTFSRNGRHLYVEGDVGGRPKREWRALVDTTTGGVAGPWDAPGDAHSHLSGDGTKDALLEWSTRRLTIRDTATGTIQKTLKVWAHEFLRIGGVRDGRLGVPFRVNSTHSRIARIEKRAWAVVDLENIESPSSDEREGVDDVAVISDWFTFEFAPDGHTALVEKYAKSTQVTTTPNATSLFLDEVPQLSTLRQFHPSLRGEAHCVAFSPEGRYVALGYGTGEILVVDARKGTLHQRFSCPREAPVALALNIASARMVSRSLLGTALLWTVDRPVDDLVQPRSVTQ